MKKLLAFGSVAILIFCSCLGMKTHVALNKNGAGTIRVDYQISQQFIAMAAAAGDGNSAIPLTRADFEKGLSGIEGVKLTGYKISDDETNRNYLLDISFTNLAALSSYLDAQGMMCIYENLDGKNMLMLFFSGNDESVDDQMRQMAPILFEGYAMDFTIDLPSQSFVRYLNMDGDEINEVPVGNITIKKNSFTFSSPMSDLITSDYPAIVELTW